jgi:hypothetical protein
MKHSMKPPSLIYKLAFYLAVLFALLLFTIPAWPASAQAEGPTETPTATATPTATTAVGPLAITAVQPNSVSNSVDTELIVTGSGFLDGAAVVLSGSSGLATTFVSNNLLRAILPAGTAKGTYAIIVVNPNAQSVSLPNALTVTAPSAETATPKPTNTPAPTAFVRPLLVVNSYGASSAEITPGSNLDFEMTIGNAGAIRASNIVAVFISGDFVARATGGVRALGNLDPGGANRFWQPLAASRDLTSAGIATLEVKVDYTDVNGTAYSDTFNLTFPVIRFATGGAAPTATPTETPTPTATTGPRLRPQLIVTSYETSVEQLQPGLNFTLSLTVQNQGNATAERITMIVGGGTATGGTTNGTPVPGGGVSGADGEFSKFAPIGTSNVQTLGNLAQGSSLEATMAFIVNAATEPGAYPVKVSFVYEDSQNGDFVDDQVVTLLVVKRPSVVMNFYAPAPPFFVGEPGSLPLQIVNAGTKTAVLGTFNVTSEGSTIENNSVFVGNLEPGGFYPLDAVIFPAEEGTQTLELAINYTDDFGQPQVITQTMDIEVMPAQVFEEPTDVFPEDMPPPEPEPETTLQKVWRFVLGLVGLSSGVPQPQPEGGFPPGGDPGFAPPIDGEFVP